MVAGVHGDAGGVAGAEDEGGGGGIGGAGGGVDDAAAGGGVFGVQRAPGRDEERGRVGSAVSQGGEEGGAGGAVGIVHGHAGVQETRELVHVVAHRRGADADGAAGRERVGQRGRRVHVARTTRDGFRSFRGVEM